MPEASAAKAVGVGRSTLVRWAQLGWAQPARTTGGSRLWEVADLRRDVIRIRQGCSRGGAPVKHPRVDQAIHALWRAGEDFPPSIIARALGEEREYVRRRVQTLRRRGYGPATPRYLS